MSGSGALINKEVLISLIVCTLGRTTPPKGFFESLLTQEHKNFEVIWWIRTATIVSTRFSRQAMAVPLRRLRTPGELGASRGAINGWPIAEGSVIVFPDDDCWYPPWFLARGLSLIAATGGLSLRPCGRRRWAQHQRKIRINRSTNQPIQCLDGGNRMDYLFQKAAILAVSGFDPEIGVGASTPWQSCEGRTLCSARWRIV